MDLLLEQQNHDICEGGLVMPHKLIEELLAEITQISGEIKAISNRIESNANTRRKINKR